MAHFTENLFDVFEEKTESVSLTGKKKKKRNRDDEKNQLEDDEQKRAKIDPNEIASSGADISLEEDANPSWASAHPSANLLLKQDEMDEESAKYEPM